jgi:DNA-binding transcriptional LysR family regulator
MADKLAGMQMFVRVVEAGSFAAAAALSNVTATMAAKHIREIEQRLAAKLLHRTTRRHQLTEIGALYYERCKRALYEFEQAEASAAELRTDPRGKLRIIAPVSFGSESLAPALADFLERYPLISVDLVLDNTPVDLMGEDYHLAVHIGEIHSNSLVARPLQAYRRILAAAPAYLDRHGQPATPEQLGDHQCLGLAYWGKKEFFWALTGPGQQVRHVPVVGRFTANDGRALRTAALQGTGIVLLPEMLLAGDLAAGRLSPVLAQWCHSPTPIYLVYPRDQRPTAMLRSAIDFLVERLAPTFG